MSRNDPRRAPRRAPQPPPNPYSQIMDRAIPSPVTVGDGGQFSGSFITQAYTYVTPVGVTQIYAATLSWANLILTLETAGPVEVSEKSNFQLLSGQAQLLIQNVPMMFKVAKGNTMYVGSSAVNRVKVTTEPLPYLEQILGAIGSGFSDLSTTIATHVGGQAAVGPAAPTYGTPGYQGPGLPPTGRPFGR